MEKRTTLIGIDTPIIVEWKKRLSPEEEFVDMVSLVMLPTNEHYRRGLLDLSPQSALRLLLWLEQEREKLEQLAEKP